MLGRPCTSTPRYVYLDMTSCSGWNCFKVAVARQNRKPSIVHISYAICNSTPCLLRLSISPAQCATSLNDSICYLLMFRSLGPCEAKAADDWRKFGIEVRLSPFGGSRPGKEFKLSWHLDEQECPRTRSRSRGALPQTPYPRLLTLASLGAFRSPRSQLRITNVLIARSTPMPPPELLLRTLPAASSLVCVATPLEYHCAQCPDRRFFPRTGYAPTGPATPARPRR